MRNVKCEQCWNDSFGCVLLFLILHRKRGEAECVHHLASWVESRRRGERSHWCAQSYCNVRSVFFFLFFALMQLFAIPLLLRETSLNVSLLEHWIIQGNATWWWSVKPSAAELHDAFCVTSMEQNAKSGVEKTSILRSQTPKTSTAELRKFSCCQVCSGLKPTWPK